MGNNLSKFRTKTGKKTLFPRASASVADWIRFLARTFAQSSLSFENGLQNPYHEAEYLTAFAFSIPLESLDSLLDSPAPADARVRMEAIMEKRLVQRLPAAYITQEAFFAGHRFRVDSRVLIPRSRIENLFDDDVGFADFVSLPQAPTLLDLCTGSGCLAVALALAYPDAQVHATDTSPDALDVAQMNINDHNLAHRIQLFKTDLFAGLEKNRYDMIVTNPPYVSKKTLDTLPVEYLHEPGMALDGGLTGLDIVERILEQARDYLTPDGVLICEAGDEGEETIMEKWPDFPGEWIYFHFGKSGVFALSRRSYRSRIG